MKIGELARRTGLRTSRIRFYEKSGLLGTIERQDNGYREYGSESLWMLEIIATAQSAGFSLQEIRRLLPEAQTTWQHDALPQSLQRKVAEIDMLQARLTQSRTQLLAAIEAVTVRLAELACADRPRWMLNRLRHAGVGKPAAI